MFSSRYEPSMIKPSRLTSHFATIIEIFCLFKQQYPYLASILIYKDTSNHLLIFIILNINTNNSNTKKL